MSDDDRHAGRAPLPPLTTEQQREAYMLYARLLGSDREEMRLFKLGAGRPTEKQRIKGKLVDLEDAFPGT